MERIRIGKHELISPIYNASGVHCVYTTQLDELYNNQYSGAVVTKSSTLQSRSGNDCPRYFSDNGYSINSSGLPNLGMNKYIDWINSKDLRKPCILSIAPLSREDLKTQLNIISDNVSIIDPEINLSCPNIEGKSQIGYEFNDMEELIRKVFEINNRTLKKLR